jgi:hypothetical protein
MSLIRYVILEEGITPQFIATKRWAEISMEANDVEDGLYTGYDSEGCLLKIEPSDGIGKISPAEDVPTHQQDLRGILLSHLAIMERPPQGDDLETLLVQCEPEIELEEPLKSTRPRPPGLFRRLLRAIFPGAGKRQLETDYIEVNGRLMDKAFLRGNIEEARQYDWHQEVWTGFKSRTHCFTCWTSIPTQREDDIYYQSCGAWLCNHCFKNFVAGEEKRF